MKNWIFKWVGLAIVGLLLVSGFAAATAATPEPPDGAAPLAEADLVSAASQVYLPLLQKSYPFRTIFGVEITNLSNTGGLPEMQAAGAYWVRHNGLFWGEVEPTRTAPAAYQWGNVAALEQGLKNARAAGMEVILVVRDTPEWAQAQPGLPCGPIAAEDLAAFGEFMHAAVKRYSSPEYSVEYYEIWNEPDVDGNLPGFDPNNPYGCWGDESDPYYGGQRFGQMLQVIDDYIRSANPQAKILVGGLLLDCNHELAGSCTRSELPSHFLEGILLSGAAPAFDGVAFHAYDYYYAGTSPAGSIGEFGNPNWQTTNLTGPVVAAKTKFITDLLQRYNVSGKFLMNTESAMLHNVGDCETNCQTTKAIYATQAYVTAKTLDLKANVWYAALSAWNNSNLLAADRTPLPAYYAFDTAQDMVGAAVFQQRFDPVANARVHVFQRDGRTIWVVWSLDTLDHAITLPSQPAEIYDYLGNPQPLTGTQFFAQVGPHFLIW